MRKGNKKRTVLAEKGHHSIVGTPDSVLNQRSLQLSNDLLLLNIEQDDTRGATKEDTRRSTPIEEVVGLRRALDRLSDDVVEVPNLNHLCDLVQNGEAVSRDEDGGSPDASFPLRGGIAYLARAHVFGKVNELVKTIVGGLWKEGSEMSFGLGEKGGKGGGGKKERTEVTRTARSAGL